MAVKNYPTKEQLHQLFEYKDGDLYWKINKNGIAKSKKAGSKNSRNYIQIKIEGSLYKAHRLIFMMHHGFLPKIIDHIDRNSLNNKIENIREATQSQNCFNRKIHKNNSTKVKNVTFDKETNKYLVQIYINGKNKKFGRYDDLELAELVAIEARDKYIGRFSNNG